MDIVMRRKNKGNYNDGRWRLKGKQYKGKEISQSLKQLSDMFNVTLTTKRESENYWLAFLDNIFGQVQDDKRKNSPLQRRLKSIEDIFTDGKETPVIRDEYERCLNIPAHDIENADVPMIHPDIEKQARAFCLDDTDEYETNILASLKPRVIKSSESVRKEIDHYIEAYKKRGHVEHYSVAQSLELFYEITGNISVQDISHEHYREWMKRVQDHETWGGTTRKNLQRYLHSFLKSMAAIHRIHVAYITLPQYRLRRDRPKKEQYTIEQLRLAVDKAEGVVRTSLLCGLNFGWTKCEVVAMTAENIIGDDMEKPRKKLEWKANIIVPCHYMWQETRRNIQYGLKPWILERAYRLFAKEHNLPSQKALRKTVAQYIHDHCGETVSRLYRGDAQCDVHMGSYIRHYTPEQKAKLKDALVKVAQWIGVEA